MTALRALLLVANASISENLAEHGAHSYSNLYPFAYDLGEDLEIKLCSSTNPNLGLTWGQLQIIVRGLWLYHIEGKRYKTSFFDVYNLQHEYVYPLIGWGWIRKPMHLAINNTAPRSLDRKAGDVPSLLELRGRKASAMGSG